MGNEASSICGAEKVLPGLTVEADLVFKNPHGHVTTAAHASVKGASPGFDSLHRAASTGNVQLLQQIIYSKQVPLSAVDARGNTALHKAAWQGNLEVCRLLVRHGAKIGVVNSSGKTPLAFAKQTGSEECASFLQDMLQRSSPEKAKNAFRSRAKTSNCPTIFGPRASIKTKAWLIPGVKHEEAKVSASPSERLASDEVAAPRTKTAPRDVKLDLSCAKDGLPCDEELLSGRSTARWRPQGQVQAMWSDVPLPGQVRSPNKATFSPTTASVVAGLPVSGAGHTPTGARHAQGMGGQTRATWMHREEMASRTGNVKRVAIV